MRKNNLKIGPTVSVFLLIVVALFFQPIPVAGASVVWADKAVYNQDETITVIFSNAPGKDSDWICIVPAGAPDTDGGDYQYMPRGVGHGSLVFAAPRLPGEYEVRAYYNYRRNGYVVSGRYAFSIVGDTAGEEVLDQGMEPIEPYDSSGSDLPPIAFAVPPNVIVFPGTDVYAVPDVEVDIFFHGGWWWRPWGGRWYRSRYYDHGWSYYRNPPSWYKRIPRDWRHGYRNHLWSGRPWNPPRINHGNLNNHWSGGHWRNDHGLGRPGKPAPPAGRFGTVKPGVAPGKPAPPRGGPGIVKPGVGPGGGPGKSVPPSVSPGGGKHAVSPGRPATPGSPGVVHPGVGPGGGSGKPAPPAVGPGGGKPVGGPGKSAPPTVGPGGGRPGGVPGGAKSGGTSGKPAVHGSGPGEGKPGGGSGGGKPGGSSGKAPLRGFGYDNRTEPGGR